MNFGEECCHCGNGHMKLKKCHDCEERIICSICFKQEEKVLCKTCDAEYERKFSQIKTVMNKEEKKSKYNTKNNSLSSSLL